MEDIISRRKAVNSIMQLKIKANETAADDTRNRILDEAIRAVSGISAEDAKPTVYGKWNLSLVTLNNTHWKCSECNVVFTDSIVRYFHFCPHCGANMQRRYAETEFQEKRAEAIRAKNNYYEECAD